MRLNEVRPNRPKKNSQPSGPSARELMDKIDSGELHPDDVPNDSIHKELITIMHQYGSFLVHNQPPPSNTEPAASTADPEKLYDRLGMVVDRKKLSELLFSDIQLSQRLERAGVISFTKKSQ